MSRLWCVYLNKQQKTYMKPIKTNNSENIIDLIKQVGPGNTHKCYLFSVTKLRRDISKFIRQISITNDLIEEL